MKNLIVLLSIILLSCGDNNILSATDKENTITGVLVGHWNTKNISMHTQITRGQYTLRLGKEKQSGYYKGNYKNPSYTTILWKVQNRNLIIKEGIDDSTVYEIEILNPGDSLYIEGVRYGISIDIDKERLILRELTTDNWGNNITERPLMFLRDEWYDPRATKEVNNDSL